MRSILVTVIARRGVGWAVVALAVSTWAPLSASPAAGAEKQGTSISISLAGNGAVAEGITPGGHVVWFVLSLDEFSGWQRLTRRVAVTLDEDHDGRVELGQKAGASSVWLAVDFLTGRYALARPDGTQPRPLPSRGEHWAAGRTHLDFMASELEVILVRPAKGAWVMRCEQGGPRDGDRRADGTLRVSLADMDLLHGEGDAAPVALPRDLIVAIDPATLLTFAGAAAGNLK